MSQEALQEIMRKVEGEPYADVLSMMLLRSMQQARYSEHNHGHYGLAAEYYTHFTSPIRRYPDLMVHRMVREYGKSQEVAEHFEQVLPDIASQSSSRERRAIDAEREVEAMKKAEYMEDYRLQPDSCRHSAVTDCKGTGSVYDDRNDNDFYYPLVCCRIKL